ncbi:MAG: thiamine-phosphate pyrophosphorylase, partial [Gaiellaceae bacterium]|nr:thiamine-phosphate pyrophosphorylase [Gaiellaceae bacterium]
MRTGAELVAVSNYPLVRVHALVSDEETARRAAAGGATVVQLRLKEAPTRDVVALGRRLVDLGAELIVNDDLDAALELGCGVHLGQNDPGVERARAA